MTDTAFYENRKRSLGEVATRQQRKASDPRRSVWVEASAGTGKTKVLTDRVLRLFLDGVRPDQILCLTYTKAAAVEMNERISSQLASWAVMPYKSPEADTDLYRALKNLTDSEPNADLVQRARTLFASGLDIPGGLKIQTIHAFCQEILKRFPLEAGIPPYFSIMDDRMVREILDNVSREMILNIEREPKSPVAHALLYLTRYLGEFTFSEMMKILINNRVAVLKILSGFPNFEAFVTALRKRLGLKEGATPETLTADYFSENARADIKVIADALAQGAPSNVAFAQFLYEVLENPENFDFARYKSIYLTSSDTLRGATKAAKAACPNIDELMAHEAERVLELEDGLKKIHLFDSTQAIMAVAGDLAERYTRYKRQNARLDYEDLIAKTRGLLENKDVADWILYKLDSSIDHILIDEAQDNSPDQWAIVRALSEDFFAGEGQNDKVRTIFAVGDRKQSIYSFQGADPTEFDAMRRYFASKTDNFSKVCLDVSFRSTEAVLETVNKVFSQENARAGVVIDNEKVSHLPYRVGQGGYVELWPLVTAESTTDKNAEATGRKQPNAALLLARQMAHFIKRTVTEKQILPSQNRPIRYGDFMILVQRRNAFVNTFIRECKNIGVEIAGIDKLKLLEQIGVEDMLSLGQFLLLPEDDLSLAEVLKSPLFGLTDDDLFALCFRRRDSLWAALRDAPKYKHVSDMLSELASKVDYVRPFELFDEVLTKYRGRQKFAERLGAEAEDALDEFMNLALQFEEEHIPDLQGFIQWMTSDDVEVKREQEQSDVDMVRVMTVHSSKGLQAPIVMLPDTVHTARAQKEQTLLRENTDMAYFPLKSDDYERCCLKIFDENGKKAFDEYRRLLYVALTRAEDRLYICGYGKKKEADARSWYALCQQTLSECGISEQNGAFSFSSPQIVTPKVCPTDDSEKEIFSEPKWADEPAPTETPLSKPYMPSHLEYEQETSADSPLAGQGRAFRRGLLIHRILQSLSLPSDRAKTAEYVRLYLRVQATELSEVQRLQIESEILKMYDDPTLAFLFGENSYAEVPVAGEVDGRLISGQIDRLYVGENDVIVVDFKTNRPAAQTPSSVPPAYCRQLECYRTLVEKIYPDKQVKTCILWTNTLNLMDIA